eukprot:gene32442-31053_t
MADPYSGQQGSYGNYPSYQQQNAGQWGGVGQMQGAAGPQKTQQQTQPGQQAPHRSSVHKETAPSAAAASDPLPLDYSSNSSNRPEPQQQLFTPPSAPHTGHCVGSNPSMAKRRALKDLKHLKALCSTATACSPASGEKMYRMDTNVGGCGTSEDQSAYETYEAERGSIQHRLDAIRAEMEKTEQEEQRMKAALKLMHDNQQLRKRRPVSCMGTAAVVNRNTVAVKRFQTSGRTRPSMGCSAEGAAWDQQALSSSAAMNSVSNPNRIHHTYRQTPKPKSQTRVAGKRVPRLAASGVERIGLDNVGLGLRAPWGDDCCATVGDRPSAVRM